MKATLHNAEQAKPDDLLTLELAYKHDPIVIALIRQFLAESDMCAAMEQLSNDGDEKINDLVATIESLKEDIEIMKDGIGEVIAGLELCKDMKKAEILEEIAGIVNLLEGLK